MRVLVVVNDQAGSGDAGLYEFIRLLGARGAEVVLRYVTANRRAESLATDAEEFDRVVSAGGDGTASAVSYATRSSGVPVLVYPAGTGNLLAANLGLPPDPPALCEALLAGAHARFDLGEIATTDATGSTRHSGFCVIAGAGYDAAIMHTAEPMKLALGAGAYLVAAIGNLAPTLARFKLTLDGEPIETDGIAVLLVNFARIQFDLPVTPRTDPQDGRLEIAVLRSKNAVGLLPAVAAALLDPKGEHPERTPIDVYSAREIRVDTEPPLPMQADGDVLDVTPPFTARVLPGAATFIVQETSPYL